MYPVTHYFTGRDGCPFLLHNKSKKQPRHELYFFFLFVAIRLRRFTTRRNSLQT